MGWWKVFSSTFCKIYLKLHFHIAEAVARNFLMLVFGPTSQPSRSGFTWASFLGPRPTILVCEDSQFFHMYFPQANRPTVCDSSLHPSREVKWYVSPIYKFTVCSCVLLIFNVQQLWVSGCAVEIDRTPLQGQVNSSLWECFLLNAPWPALPTLSGDLK